MSGGGGTRGALSISGPVAGGDGGDGTAARLFASSASEVEKLAGGGLEVAVDEGVTEAGRTLGGKTSLQSSRAKLREMQASFKDAGTGFRDEPV